MGCFPYQLVRRISFINSRDPYIGLWNTHFHHLSFQHSFPIFLGMGRVVDLGWFSEVSSPKIPGRILSIPVYCPKDHWTLQWKGLNLYSRGRVLKIASFEGSGYLGWLFFLIIGMLISSFMKYSPHNWGFYFIPYIYGWSTNAPLLRETNG